MPLALRELIVELVNTGALRTTMVDCVEVSAPLLLVALTAKVNEPDSVGVPETLPVSVFKETPSGSVPRTLKVIPFPVTVGVNS